jgi:hypothetical protein
LSEKRSKCDACKVEFEKGTKAIATKDNRYYHHGCWAKINRAIIIDPGPEQLLFMREPLSDQIEGDKVVFQVKHV